MPFLSPTSIAVIGASSEEGKVGYEIFKNLLNFGFKGTVYPVNVKRDEVQGKKAYPSIKNIPEAVDVAVIVTPASTVMSVLKECADKGVKNVIVISAGFGELGTEDGKKAEQELAAFAKEHQINLVGPNCLGILRPSIGMNASFAVGMPPTGGIALISQSGALEVAIIDRAERLGLGFSTVISIGNKAVMDECDFLELCRDDPETKVIGLYLESINNGQRFLSLAEEIGKKKPIVLIKSGVTEKGGKAVSSHTGALAGSDAAIDAACIQAGIHRAKTLEEFLQLLPLLSTQPSLASANIAILTNAGGPGILATDEAEKTGLILPSLSDASQAALKKVLPPAASVHNPIDVLGDALADRYEAAISIIADDPSIDGIVALLTPQVMTPCLKIAEAIVKVKRTHPLIPIVTSFVGETHVREAVTYLQSHGIPQYETPEQAVRAMARLTEKTHSSLPSAESVDHTRARTADGMLQHTTGLLDEKTVAQLLNVYELPQPSQCVVKDAQEAVAASKKIGFPLIAKIQSPDILHKTDIGGIRTNLQSVKEVEQAVDEILTNVSSKVPTAQIDGVLLQKFLPAGSEFIVGALRDPSFGPMIMVGLGGIYTELFRDTCFRLAPVSEEEAYDMLQSLRSWKLLLGLRGQPPFDIPTLAGIIHRTSHLIAECPSIKEIDFNPVLVEEKTATVVDAKIVLG